MTAGKTIQIKQCRPSEREMSYFWKLFHAAQRVEDRWHNNTVPLIAEALANTELSRGEKLFLLRSWQVLVDDKGGFGRFMGAFDTYVYNVQDPDDRCVAYKPEMLECIENGNLFNVLLEAYSEAQKHIADLESRVVAIPDDLDFDCEFENGGCDIDGESWLRGRVDGFNDGVRITTKALRAAGFKIKGDAP